MLRVNQTCAEVVRRLVAHPAATRLDLNNGELTLVGPEAQSFRVALSAALAGELSESDRNHLAGVLAALGA